MGLTSFIALGMIAFVIGIFVFLFKADRSLYKNKPYLFSFIALFLVVLNWVLYITSFYVLLPEIISDVIFIPLWFFIASFGIIAAWREYKNNMFMALFTGGLCIISFMFGGVFELLSAM